MKKKFLKTSTIFLLFILLGSSAYTGSNLKYASSIESCTATIGLQSPIVISGTSICTDYIASISNMGFTSQSQAQKYFQRYTCNLVSFEVLYSQSQVKIVLHPERLRSAWTVQQWNQYLENKQSKFLN